MKNRNAVFLTILLVVLELIINFLFEIMPDYFKNTISIFSNRIGLSYTSFWIFCTLIIVLILLLLIWKQALKDTDGPDKEKQPGIIKRQTNIKADKLTYIEIQKGNINVK